MVFINQKIVHKFGKTFFQEGCLSFPGNYVLTERWTNIVVKCENDPKEMTFSFDKSPLECVCVQHEIDHLNGILFLDHLSSLKRNLYKKKVKKWLSSK